MGTLEQVAPCDSIAFSLKMRHVPRSAATTSRTDVFSQLQRSANATHSLAPRPIPFSLKVGDEPISLVYLDTGPGLPPWLKPVLTSLSERWGVGKGWDTYDAKPTDLNHVLKLLNILFSLLKPISSPPTITPLVDGGVQAEWHVQEKDFEIVVSADDPPRFFLYDAGTGDEEAGLLDEDYPRVRKIIESL